MEQGTEGCGLIVTSVSALGPHYTKLQSKAYAYIPDLLPCLLGTPRKCSVARVKERGANPNAVSTQI